MLRPLAALLLLLPLSAPATDFSVEPDENNVTAGRLDGRWEADPIVDERLGVRPSKNVFEFEEDASIAGLIPAKYDEFLGKAQIFEAGILSVFEGDKLHSTGPYLLIVHAGNPHVITFRERNGEPLGDAESSNMFVAPGKDKSKDLLLIGGDFNNEPFRAFRRVSE